jgi:superfamily I DNA/RNA helicase
LLPLAQKLWTKMIDLNDPTLMPHDGYLKLWVLSRPDLSEFDVILLDEGQDANPLLLSLLLQQWKNGRCALVIVGDRHQSIYLWRGATNAMQYCDTIATQKFVLTECFRFPQFIANHANAILHEFKREKNRLIGRGRDHSTDGPPAFISRTNAGLLERAITAVAQGKSINFAATTAGSDWNPYVPYKFGEILDVLAHSMGESYRVKTPYLRRYASFDEICEAVEGEHPDVELKAMVDVVNRYGAALPRIVDDIARACVAPNQADLCFSSGHRSKGKEWSSTELNGDFLPVHDPAKLEEMKNKLGRAGFEQEVNLFYVALTRTKTVMTLPATYTSWFNPRLAAQRAA